MFREKSYVFVFLCWVFSLSLTISRPINVAVNDVISFFMWNNVPRYRYRYIIYTHTSSSLGFPGGASGKEPTDQCRRHERCGFDRWIGKIPWRRAWQPIPVFLPGESQGERSLAAAVRRVTKSQTRWKRLSTHTSSLSICLLMDTCLQSSCFCHYTKSPFDTEFLYQKATFLRQEKGVLSQLYLGFWTSGVLLIKGSLVLNW